MPQILTARYIIRANVRRKQRELVLHINMHTGYLPEYLSVTHGEPTACSCERRCFARNARLKLADTVGTGGRGLSPIIQADDKMHVEATYLGHLMLGKLMRIADNDLDSVENSCSMKISRRQ